MKRFLALYRALDRTTSTSRKVAALRAYFEATPREDAAWGLLFLSGWRIKRLLPGGQLLTWAAESAALPAWLATEAYHPVGDQAEATALLLDLVHPPGGPSDPRPDDDLPLSRWMDERLLPLAALPPDQQRASVEGWWARLDTDARFILNKLLTGELRVGVSRTLVVRALAELADLPPAVVSHRLMGPGEPTAAWLEGVLAAEAPGAHRSQPYPFLLAAPLDGPPEALGPVADFLAEWKWDGIRAQLIRRAGETFVWSRGEELVTERFPEIVEAAATLPDGTVLDGEILAWQGDAPLPFARLQRRIGRKTLTRKVLAEAPAALVAYDLLEQDGQDLRERPLSERRARLERLLAGANPRLRLSPVVTAADWPDLARQRDEARARGVEGLMLKRLDARYLAGRRRGVWWKWKVDPYSIDAVLVTAQPGSGRRASLLTDYGFAVWHEGALVPIAKAYSGLTDDEIRALDPWLRRHTRERHGPVRVVAPEQVFELAFEGLQRSPRHKSGLALRFPRILRWRRDKPAAEADTLDTLRALLAAHESGHDPTTS